ncbi:MAG: hypothetical protein KC478_14410 [Bacteriovoracaceae bacterium]|nr:hypothetical protein [Bacteriovoracaceae bacterium]
MSLLPTNSIGVHLNIYHGASLSIEVDVDTQGVLKLHQRAPGHPQTQMGWTIEPGAIYWRPEN